MTEQTGTQQTSDKNEFSKYLESTQSKIHDDSINTKINGVKEALNSADLQDDLSSLEQLELELTEEKVQQDTNLGELKTKVTDLKASITQQLQEQSNIPSQGIAEAGEKTDAGTMSLEDGDLNSLLDNDNPSISAQTEQTAGTDVTETSEKPETISALEQLRITIEQDFQFVSKEDLSLGLKVKSIDAQAIEIGADETQMADLASYDIVSDDVKKMQEGPFGKFLYPIMMMFKKFMAMFSGETFNEYDLAKLKLDQKIGRYLNSLGFGDDKKITSLLGKVKDTKFSIVTEMISQDASDEDIVSTIIKDYDKRIGLNNVEGGSIEYQEKKSLVKIVKFLRANSRYLNNMEPSLNEKTTFDQVVQNLFQDQSGKSYAMPKQNVIMLDFATYQYKDVDIPASAVATTIPKVKVDENTKIDEAKIAVQAQVQASDGFASQTSQEVLHPTQSKINPPVSGSFTTVIDKTQITGVENQENTNVEQQMSDQEFKETFSKYDKYRNPKIETAINDCARIPFLIKYLDDISQNQQFIQRAKSLGLDYPDVMDFDEENMEFIIGDKRYAIQLTKKSNGDKGMLKKLDMIQVSFELEGGKFQIYNKGDKVDDLTITKSRMLTATIDMLDKGEFDFGEKHGYNIDLLAV